VLILLPQAVAAKAWQLEQAEKQIERLVMALDASGGEPAKGLAVAVGAREASRDSFGSTPKSNSSNSARLSPGVQTYSPHRSHWRTESAGGQLAVPVFKVAGSDGNELP
jgi:hypothetical protein